ncbi:hypothetical protein A0H81_13566 [Grifola frondosa]|uniref:Uncharacterized protein n=1 Tax=Grifola frondosa TaxID=5627 RepID=A0A1C7LQ81_GRIFR|nr:hypothetical protein A0H81_13566 [Grifola frondosa]
MHGMGEPSAVQMFDPQQQRPGSAGHAQQELDARYGAGAPRGNPFSPNPHGGIALPPLNAALGAEGMMMPMGPMGGHMINMMPFSNASPSYVRSGSAGGNGAGAPSRTHSPLAGPGMSSGPGTMLPPPQNLAHFQPHGLNNHGHPHSFYHHSSPPPTGGLQAMSGVPLMPSLADLERHYFEMGEQRRKLEEMLARTDRMMEGMRRGMEEMKAGSKPQSAQGTSQGEPQPSSQAVPLNRSERPGSRESVWPVAPAESAPRD